MSPRLKVLFASPSPTNQYVRPKEFSSGERLLTCTKSAGTHDVPYLDSTRNWNPQI